jgi:hypothetical protein
MRRREGVCVTYSPELESIDRGNDFSKNLRARLGKSTRGAIDVTGLVEQL